MVTQLNKTDIVFDELRLSRVRQPDGTYIWYVDVGYRVLTAEGEEFNRNKQIELTGARKTTAKNYLQAIYADIKAEEGIS